MNKINKKTFGAFQVPPVWYCKKCNSIIKFPFTKIGYNVWSVQKTKQYGFRVIERFSEDRGEIWCGKCEMYREEMNSCMNCCNSRGYDCDEHWSESSCRLLHIYNIAPFTICDLHGIDLDIVKIDGDGKIWGKYYHDKNYKEIKIKNR